MDANTKLFYEETARAYRALSVSNMRQLDKVATAQFKNFPKAILLPSRQDERLAYAEAATAHMDIAWGVTDRIMCQTCRRRFATVTSMEGGDHRCDRCNTNITSSTYFR